jgi:hypothetical protein
LGEATSAARRNNSVVNGVPAAQPLIARADEVIE